MAEEDLCRAVGEDLTKHYPGYDWMVGATLDGGTVAINLMVDDEPAMASYGYLLHLNTIVGPGGQHRVMQAGGELLERWGLPIGAAPDGWRKRAQEHGLDICSAIGKSRNGG